MDFVSVPAGTLDAAALALRGADHDVDMLANDFLMLLSTGKRLTRTQPCWWTQSHMSLQCLRGLSGHLFLRDPLVMACTLRDNIPLVVKLRSIYGITKLLSVYRR